MGPIRTDIEVYTSVKDRPDAYKVLERLVFFTNRIQSKGREIDRLREQVGKSDPVTLADDASRVSEEISRLEAEREAYIDSVLA